MKLFDDVPRTDPSPAGYSEDSFTFLNRVNHLYWQRVRDVLEAWFADYPEEHQASLRGHFRSKKPGQHHSAFWELYLHHLFARVSYDVTVHPDVPGTSNEPDFELVRGDERLYVEAAVVFSGVVDEQRDAIRDAWIMDAVDKATHPDFHVLIDFVRHGKNRPRDKDVYGPLTAWLDTLDPDEIIREFDQTGSVPRRTFSIQDWELQFEAIPIKPEARGAPGRLLGGGPATSGCVDDVEQLRDTLKHKRGKYGHPDIPLVVAVNCASSFMESDDIAGALYGSIGIQPTPGQLGSAQIVRQRDATWMREGGAQGQRMSAVLSGVQIHPLTVVTNQLIVWHNPWAFVPLHVDWPFSLGKYTDTGHVDVAGNNVDMADVLGLPSGWPGPDRPFA